MGSDEGFLDALAVVTLTVGIGLLIMLLSLAPAYSAGYSDYPNDSLYNELRPASYGVFNSAGMYCLGFDAARDDSIKKVTGLKLKNRLNNTTV